MSATYVPSLLSELGGTITTASISDFAESVDDRVAALLVEGAGIDITYNDVSGTLTIAATGGGGGSGVHGDLTELTDDDHPQYALLAGRSGGQSLVGGTASGDDLTLASTSHATKGDIAFGATGTKINANGTISVRSSVASVVVGMDVFDTVADLIYFQVGKNSGQCVSMQYTVTTGGFNFDNQGGPIFLRSTTLTYQNAAGDGVVAIDASGDVAFHAPASDFQRPVAGLVRTWADPVSASRRGRLIVNVNDYAADREAIRVEADGAEARIGFLGHAAVVRQTGDVGAALVALGLMTSPTTPKARVYTFVPGGGVAETTGTDRTNWVTVERACTISKAWISAKTAPTGASLIVDLLKSSNGGTSFTSLWASTPANRVALAATSRTGSQTAFDTTSLAAGDLLRIDVIQVGSTIAGTGVTVQLVTEGV